MKTLKDFIDKYNKKQNEIELYFDEMESYQGNYKISVTRCDFNLTAWYTFKTVKEFIDWINNVIFD